VNSSAWAASRAVAALAAAVCAAGCGPDLGPERPARGPAAPEVTVVRGAEPLPAEAAITGWVVRAHPQVPDEGPAVFATHRFTGTYSGRIALQACAVDGDHVVLLCAEVEDDGIDEFFLGPYATLDRTAEVLLVPDQRDAGGAIGDPKDHDGYVPPSLLGPGDRL
jgi:hypothetical protein